MHSRMTLALMGLVAMLFSTGNAHMIMATPTPYGKSTLNNSPLAADGSDFPCKQRTGVYDAEGASNTMAIGANQTLSFIGSAVHGGGSCQVSLTTDLQPTASSNWQVIYSIIGGCPANAPGNLPDNPSGTGASTFQFSIPDGIAPGQYTLAWTWFNKIGNREMYMNCAPVTVTGGSSKRRRSLPGFSKRTTFPEMFVANVGSASNICTTEQSTDLVFPDPGANVQYAGQASTSAQAAPSPSGCVGTFNAVAPAGGSAANNSAPAPAPTTAAAGAGSSAAGAGSSAATSAGSSAAATVVSLSFGSASTAAAAPTAVTITGTTLPTAAAPSAPSAAAPTASSSANTPTAGALTGACSTEGEWNCIGGSSFQQCASGAWSIVQPVAAGTQCTPGEGSNLNITKRGVRFSREHLARHHRRFVS